MLVHVESNSLLLRARAPQTIRNLIPKARDIDYEGHNIAVRHGLDETKVLRNIGVNAPPPILYYYNWPGKYPQVLEHQKQTAAFMSLYNRAYCFNEPGTMKTASVLWAADYLMQLGFVRKVLVVAPNTTLDITWREEVFSCLMHRTVAVLTGSKTRREDLLATDSDIYIINHHGLETIADNLRSRTDINLVIGDECDVWVNAGTALYDTMEEVTRHRKVWLLSGTPCPNAPTDAWALTRLINKNRVPQYFGQWRRQTMLQVSTYKWIPRVDSYEMAYQAMQPAIRYLKKDCLDLPPTVITRRHVECTPAQKKALTQMHNDAVMDAAAGIKITAVNAADKINKMRQILCGVIKDTETGDYIEVDHRPRVDELLHMIAHASTKVIVIVPFKGIIKSLAAKIGQHYSVEVINGDVTRTERTAILRRFKDTPDPYVLLCHPRVMAHGLNLAESATIVMYAPIYSNRDFSQVKERIARPGQTRTMTQIRISAHPLELEIYSIVDAKGISQAKILDLYRHQILGTD